MMSIRTKRISNSLKSIIRSIDTYRFYSLPPTLSELLLAHSGKKLTPVVISRSKRPRLNMPPPPLKKKKSLKDGFRANRLKYFLTYPHITCDPQTVMNKVIALSPQPIRAIVASEKHKDGTDHVHIFLEYATKRDIRDCHIYDHLCGKHCQISPVKDAGRTLKYITKGDNYCLFGLTEGFIRAVVSGTSYTLGEVAADIEVNPDINYIALKYPTHFIHYSRGITKLVDIHRHRKSTKTIAYDWSHFDDVRREIGRLDAQSNISLNMLLDWFERNFRHINEDNYDRPLRDKQLWIHGATRTGKSSFIMFLRRFYRAQLVPAREKFTGGYNDYDIDWLYLEEFYGAKQLQFLNSLLGGEPMNLAWKGGQYTKLKNKPVVIASNLLPSQCYPRVSISQPTVWEAFLDRLQVIEFTRVMQLPTLITQLSCGFPSLNLKPSSPLLSQETLLVPSSRSPSPVLGSDFDTSSEEDDLQLTDSYIRKIKSAPARLSPYHDASDYEL